MNTKEANKYYSKFVGACFYCGHGIPDHFKKCILFNPDNKEIDLKILENLEVINKQQWDKIQEEFAKTNHCKRTKSKFEFATLFVWLEKNFNAPDKK